MSQETYQDYGIELPMTVAGQKYATCPKCSESRKKSNDKCLGVDTDRQIWHCNHCGWSGMLKNHIDLPTRTPRPKYKKPDWKPTKDLPKKVIQYFKDRGISESTLKNNDIQYDNEIYFPQVEGKLGAICFPYKRKNEIVNVKYRSGKKHFRQEKDAEKIFFGLDSIGVNEKTLIITEGEIDKLSFDEIGYNFAVSVPDGAPAPGTKNFRSKFEYLENCKSELAHITAFILAVDNDPAGKTLEHELARRLGFEKCLRVAYPDDCKDANEVLVKHGVEGLKVLIGTAKPFPVIGVNGVSDLHTELVNLYHNGFASVFSTGWTSVDEYYKVRPGEMTILTGYTGHGKSEFLDALLINLAKLHNWKFGVCSLENLPYERHVLKLAEKVTGKAFFQVSDDRMTEAELTQAESFLQQHFFFINPDQVEIDTILKIGKDLIYRHGINGLIIDPYNELDHNRLVGISETEYVSQFLSKVRRFARLNDIAVWVVAHPTKPNTAKIVKAPTVYGISGSANWANKADNALSVFRGADNKVQIHIKKVRFKEVGHLGQAGLGYDQISGRYFDFKPKAKTEKAVQQLELIND
ncbi:MAG: toprim domain-containing protein [Chloroflexi bacterium]|jgi:twinkle protein|nr:toprim domain-containing protein [Chloroflexota bacterium]